MHPVNFEQLKNFYVEGSLNELRRPYSIIKTPRLDYLHIIHEGYVDSP